MCIAQFFFFLLFLPSNDANLFIFHLEEAFRAPFKVNYVKFPRRATKIILRWAFALKLS